jgi:hypothetical protein
MPGQSGKLTAEALPWTAGAVTVQTPNGILSAAGFNGLTLNGGGQLRLVSPVQVTVTSPALSVPHSIGIIAELDIQFVPEPVTALLFGAGALCLGILGRGRRIR